MPDAMINLGINDNASRKLEMIIKGMVRQFEELEKSLSRVMATAGVSTAGTHAGTIGAAGAIQGLAQSGGPAGAATTPSNTRGAFEAHERHMSSSAGFYAQTGAARAGWRGGGYNYGGSHWDSDPNFRRPDKDYINLLHQNGRGLIFNSATSRAGGNPYDEVDMHTLPRRRLFGGSNTWVQDRSNPNIRYWQDASMARSLIGGIPGRVHNFLNAGMPTSANPYRTVVGFGQDMLGRMGAVAGVGFGLDYAAQMMGSAVQANAQHTIDLGNLQKRVGWRGGSQDAFHRQILDMSRTWGFTNDESVDLAKSYGSILGRPDTSWRGMNNEVNSGGAVDAKVKRVLADITGTGRGMGISIHGSPGDFIKGAGGLIGNVLKAGGDISDLAGTAINTVGRRKDYFTQGKPLGEPENNLTGQMRNMLQFGVGFGLSSTSVGNIFGTATQQGIINSSDTHGMNIRQLGASIADATEAGGMSGRIEEMAGAMNTLVGEITKTTVSAPNASTVLGELATLGRSGQRGLQGANGAVLLGAVNQQISTMGGDNLPAKIFLEQAIGRGMRRRGQATDFLSIKYQAEGGIGDAHNLTDVLDMAKIESGGLLPNEKNLGAAYLFQQALGLSSMHQAINFVKPFERFKNGKFIGFDSTAVGNFSNMLAANNGMKASDIKNEAVLPFLAQIAHLDKSDPAYMDHLKQIASSAAKANIWTGKDGRDWKDGQQLFNNIAQGRGLKDGVAAGLSGNDLLKSDMDVAAKDFENLAKAIQPVTQFFQKHQKELMVASIAIGTIVSALQNNAVLIAGVSAGLLGVVAAIKAWNPFNQSPDPTGTGSSSQQTQGNQAQTSVPGVGPGGQQGTWRTGTHGVRVFIPSPALPSSGTSGQQIVAQGQALLGTPYDDNTHGHAPWTDPYQGHDSNAPLANRPDMIDCSSFVAWTFAKLGYKGYLQKGPGRIYDTLANHGLIKQRDRTASAFQALGKKLQPGDLLFFDDPNYMHGPHGNNDKFSHVGIYEGNGKMISATGTPGNVNETQIFDPATGAIQDRYWGKYLAGWQSTAGLTSGSSSMAAAGGNNFSRAGQAKELARRLGIPAGVAMAWLTQENAKDPSRHNPLNIMDRSGHHLLKFKDDGAGIDYATHFLTDFDKAGYYKNFLNVAHRKGSSPAQIMAALGASPFDAGHYREDDANGNHENTAWAPGHDLQNVYRQFAGMDSGSVGTATIHVVVHLPGGATSNQTIKAQLIPPTAGNRKAPGRKPPLRQQTISGGSAFGPGGSG